MRGQTAKLQQSENCSFGELAENNFTPSNTNYIKARLWISANTALFIYLFSKRGRLSLTVVFHILPLPGYLIEKIKYFALGDPRNKQKSPTSLLVCVEDCCGSMISEQMEGWVLIRGRERHG